VRFFGLGRSAHGLVLLLTICAPLLSGACLAETRREATGWLQLDRDQRTYRERVEPLDLRDQRRLETIERSQRNELRALQQRQERAARADLGARGRQHDGDAPRQIPRRDRFLQQRQGLERKRLEFRMQQDRLPFGR
jgi:hypothetical protein